MATPTIRDVAREAAVSVASASRALNGHSNVTDKTRKRVIEAAARLSYVPHSGARSLTMRHTGTIGVVLPDLFGEFFSEIIRGIDRAAHQRGLQLLLANMHGSPEETASAIRAMRGRVDGLLVMSPNVDCDFLAANLPGGLPTVMLNGHIDGIGHGSLSIDNYAAAQAMVGHLVDRGYRRIAHIAGPIGNSDAEERLRGFRHAMTELLGDANPLVFPGDFSEDAGREAGRSIAADPQAVDAVFAANDVMAVGCMSALEEAGVAVPARIAVSGFDDIPIARYVTPSLTTMRVRIAELGTQAFETLAEILANPHGAARPPLTLMPELVVRQSTMAAPA
ncbi:LacI family DNA-binding transcriptional regulator [Sphingomonas sp. LaA6.9]|uniref:LacI family DNA-binding transcriptional regulator n=1 Tax=Sphingomonas sp. LaA6.9 TaxID=2919914 RepID=UPI001F4FE55F|nr:LacI family DNA-binding transcriptional regulator [Sphingomonas sp. LaA6.9]MCJ8156427.1 LacI family transcriptional regulator [Sphingomonas sp. LaA6.9]